MSPAAFLHLNFLVEPAKYKKRSTKASLPNMSGHALRARTSQESIFEPVELVAASFTTAAGLGLVQAYADCPRLPYLLPQAAPCYT
jgi:hypothetical protein